MALTDADILAILEETGALRTGHFTLTSGRHSNRYVQCAQLMRSPKTTLMLAEEAVSRLPEEVREAATLVVSPAVGGITFGFALGLALDRDFIFAERQDGKMTLRRNFTIAPEDRVIVAEDVVTTGGSVKEVSDLVEAAGAEVVGVVSLIDRKTDRLFDAPFYPLLALAIESWAPEDCPLCAQGLKSEAPGSRKLA